MKLWGGRFTESTNQLVESYTSSISFDRRLAEWDIAGSIAHARMLGHCGIITESKAHAIIQALETLIVEIRTGEIEFRVEDEDIHMNVERLLHERIPSAAGMLHTARSRNDQVALDMHLFMKQALSDTLEAVRGLQAALLTKAEDHVETIIPGYTHLQRAQPVRLAHHLLAYFWMFERDAGRISDAALRTDMMPLGAGALAGTTFPIKRQMVAEELGFSSLYENSLDAVSDRDYLVEFLSIASILMMHLSRFAEELVLWSSEEFGFIELADAYCTGSSMMPQKKNPDVPELVRGKTGRVYGHLMALLTVLKGLPLAYNKDLQEDKEGVFDTVDTLLPALWLFRGLIETMKVREERIEGMITADFSSATDLADYLVRKGMAFREAHAVVGQLVLYAVSQEKQLLSLSLSEYQAQSALFDEDIFACIQPAAVVDRRSARGGTAKSAILEQLHLAHTVLESHNEV